MVKHSIGRIFLLIGALFALNMPANAAAPKVDFNGDGNGDLLWYNTITGELGAWLLSGTTLVEPIVYAAVDPNTHWKPFGVGDFNGDTKTDVFWYNTSTGELVIYLIDGTNVIGFSGTRVRPNTGWRIAGFGDFNADGQTDVLWRNITTGEIGAWLVGGPNAGVLGATIYLSVELNAGWRVRHIADFNGDGTEDLFWDNTSTGENVAWFIATGGSTLLGTATYPTVEPTTGWVVKYFGNLNSDNRPDLFWRNNVSGGNVAWFLDGPTVIGFQPYQDVDPGSGWRDKGSGDFDGDGLDDMFWQNVFSGEIASWLVNDGFVLPTFTSYGIVPTALGWQASGFSDFNGDLRDDVFWRNTITGEVGVWLVNGPAVLATTVFGVPPAGWITVFPDPDTDRLHL